MWVDRVLSPTPFLWGKGGAGILKVEELCTERRCTKGEGRDLREEEQEQVSFLERRKPGNTSGKTVGGQVRVGSGQDSGQQV